jgi:small multidrug resistance family-3 protein
MPLPRWGEIAGCFAFWTWPRLGRSVLCVVPGLGSLATFASLLTHGRREASLCGIRGVTVGSLLWLCVAGARQPDVWDLSGATVCLLGAGVIRFGPHRA